MALLCGAVAPLSAQVAINNTGATPNGSAVLDVSSTTQGLLLPRMTTAQRMAIANPANGLLVFDTDRQAIATFSASSGWGILATDPPGKVQVSDRYPDPLYPAADYDYLGAVNVAAFKKNFGLLPGSWSAKTAKTPDQTVNLSYTSRKLCYTGSPSRKILAIGNQYPSDSAIAVYDISADSVYKESIGSIARFGAFTATSDTANARIFIYGGTPRLFTQTTAPYYQYNPQYQGYAYYYNTGVKVPFDSASSPLSYRREGHTAVWASAAGKLLVWGGTTIPYNSNASPTIAPATLMAYSPATNNWQSLATCPLLPRVNHFAVYDGNDRMLVWGGDNYPTDYFDGAVYTISTNTWTLMSTANAPTAKMASVSWTGSEMMVSNTTNNPTTQPYLAYRYNPTTNTWTKLPDLPVLDGYGSRISSNHVWSVSNMLQPALLNGINTRPILWSYDVGTNSWTPLAGEGLSAKLGIQAGSTTVYNDEYGTIFQQYRPGGTSPSYGDQSVYWHYFKKK